MSIGTSLLSENEGVDFSLICSIMASMMATIAPTLNSTHEPLHFFLICWTTYTIPRPSPYPLEMLSLFCSCRKLFRSKCWNHRSNVLLRVTSNSQILHSTCRMLYTIVMIKWRWKSLIHAARRRYNFAAIIKVYPRFFELRYFHQQTRREKSVKTSGRSWQQLLKLFLF